ncbi:hypothetical protein RCH33_3062 [Flavobacterium daejeonense]|nr:hypothetical protein RCH33_3062 [Flavobacterium daejeonense]
MNMKANKLTTVIPIYFSIFKNIVFFEDMIEVLFCEIN